ncbi:DUF4157 domain-containing protein [Streptomyces sp. NPDC047002]|uniref:DUF4157 domain-containing protein n=1 Tax=Streptomyces sp. NPDC047002 TaxID=3155475 RepID=UPI00345149C4
MHAEDRAGAAVARGGGELRRRRGAKGRALRPGLLALQGAVGNAAVVQMLDRAGRLPAGERDQGRTDGDRAGAESPGQAAPRRAVQDVLRTPGRPLDDPARAEMEARLGADFSGVRVHTGSAAEASAAAIGARAYTSSEHVVLGSGGRDRHTLAHELAHVVQQRRGPVAGTDDGTGLRLSDSSDPFEREAEATAARVMSVPPPSGVHAPPAGTHPEAAVPSATAAAPVQRALYLDEDATQRPLTREEVLAAPWYQELHPGHQQRVEPYIDHDVDVAVGTVIEATRNTVVGAVEGQRRQDTDFLEEAWHRKRNLNAYDLEMQAGRLTEALTELGIPPQTLRLTKGSIKGFGHHVPHTDVLVPHPGNIWAMSEAPESLARCLESIMGADSTAWVFTDNEQDGHSQAEAISAAVDTINGENSGVAGYVPLAVQVEHVRGKTVGDTYELAGVPLVIGHQSPYRLVTVTRA